MRLLRTAGDGLMTSRNDTTEITLLLPNSLSETRFPVMSDLVERLAGSQRATVVEQPHGEHIGAHDHVVRSLLPSNSQAPITKKTAANNVSTASSTRTSHSPTPSRITFRNARTDQ